MKTNEPSAPAAPGNQSVRQLAATLTKTTPAPSQPKTEEPGATAPTEPAEPTEPHEPPAEPTAPESLTTVESDAPETPEAEPAPEPEAEPEPSPDAETAKPLPKELVEAIEVAKKQGAKGVAKLLERLHKVVDIRDTERNARLQAEEQNAQLRTELQQLKTQKPEAATPVGVHPEVHKVNEELNNVDTWLGWCEKSAEQLQSGEVEMVEAPDGKGGKVQVGLKDVLKTKSDLEKMRQEVVARKVQTEKAVRDAFQEAFQQSHQAALTKFPQFADPNSDWSQRAKQIIEAMPGIKSFPDHEILIGHFLRGLELDAQAAKALATPTRKPAPAREPAKVNVTPPGSGAEPEEPTEKKKKESNQQFQKTGSTRDLARTLTASRQASRTPKR